MSAERMKGTRTTFVTMGHSAAMLSPSLSATGIESDLFFFPSNVSHPSVLGFMGAIVG